jgi:hypothetical protein
MSFVKMTKILKSRMDLIFFLTLLIVLTGVYVWLEIDDPAKIWEKKPVKIQCKDPNISHPMASDQLIFWKNLLIALGIIFSFVLQIASIFSDRIESRINVIRERAIIIPLVRWITCFLIGLLGLLIITQSGLAEVLISNHYYVARNFLAVCQPHQLDLLCGNPDSQNWIGAICTTPVEIWMPAVKSMLPKMMIFYYYLILTSLIRMFIKWHWKEMLYSGLILQAIGIAFIVGVGVFSVFYCNEGHPSGVMVGGLLILWMSFSWVVIDAVLAFLNDDNFPDEEEELPLYWNDVLQENIIPQFGQLPITTVLPACGYQYPKLMETGLKPQKDNYIDTPRSPELYKWEDIALGDPPDLITLY